MGSSFTLADTPSLDDLQVFLARAARIEEGTVRLIAGSGVLAVYAAVFYPQGLLDESPTVLGLRTVALSNSGSGPEGGNDDFDVVVPIRSLLGRLEAAQEARRADPTITAHRSDPSRRRPRRPHRIALPAYRGARRDRAVRRDEFRRRSSASAPDVHVPRDRACSARGRRGVRRGEARRNLATARR